MSKPLASKEDIRNPLKWQGAYQAIEPTDGHRKVIN